ncbi:MULTISPECIES: DUF2254 domain-containing protein [Nitrosomonas]|uniref:Putative membrane protein n=1 Tax=Nitrosomonas communis TaxID=44574 RepID=A0A0F7KFM0_9PROT|nr:MULTISPECIES: DUF2254 domain-containing protein [Nitrosomonas]AKH37612.1 hypothetical protein AAW31_06950 [Nitrosomonas communis]TYP72999.1 putative membrane protein [Nitrosomonas communis]UVS62886.1 DUF2254 domain-containing protein [Nitrosomonas sp. PLL12]
MKRPQQLWIYLRSSFWFLPAIIVAASIALAAGAINVESAIESETLARWPRLFGAGAEGARQMLSTIANSMMAVVGVTFSMTLVTLTLASSQYTSRVLGSFIRNRTTQTVLGIFAGIFTYCLLVLRTIRDNGEDTFVPGIAVFLGVFFALAGIGVLILFIHHIATSIQASNIICSVAEDTIAAIKIVFPERNPHNNSKEDETLLRRLLIEAEDWEEVLAGKSGYIQSIDYEALKKLAHEKGTIIKTEHGIGNFVVKGAPLASLPRQDLLEEKTFHKVCSFYGIDSHRTIEQDPDFGIRQIVDMAVKALSPGVNDTTTVITCIDYLTSILCFLVQRNSPLRIYYEKGEPRLIRMNPTFETLLDTSFEEIRRNASGNARVIISMLDALKIIGATSPLVSHRKALGEQAKKVAELAEGSIESTHDLAAIRARLETLHIAVDPNPPANR